jgi:hypothetical protein
LQRACGPEQLRIEAGREANGRPGRNEAMRRSNQQDPETAPLRCGPLPFPAPRFSAGREALSRLPYGAPKTGAVWTGPPSPQRQNPTEKGEWELGRSLAPFGPARLPLVGAGRSSGGQPPET